MPTVLAIVRKYVVLKAAAVGVVIDSCSTVSSGCGSTVIIFRIIFVSLVKRGEKRRWTIILKH